MKSKLQILLVLILNLGLIFSMVFSKQLVHAEGDVEIVFNDAHLEAVIRQHLNLNETEPILKDNLETLTNLDASKRNISDLTGLEYAINLEDVDLSWNFIEDYQYFNPVNMLGLDLSFNKIKVVQHIENIKILNLRHNDITDITELDNFSPDYDLTINLTENLIDFENSENLDIISQFENTSVVVLYENQHQVKTRPPFRPIILEIEKTLVGEDETVFNFEIIGMLPSFENTFASEYYYTFDEFESESAITNNGKFNITVQGVETAAFMLYVKHPFYDFYFKTVFNLNGELINPITGIEIEAHATTLDVDLTLNLYVLIEPENASMTDVIWLSTNPEKASISNEGIVLAHQRGEVEIIAVTVDGGFEANTTIEVIQPVTSVKINESVTTLNVGETEKLTATVSPEDANNQNVTWSSSNPEVLSVDQEGNLQALVKGETTITVTTEDGEFKDMRLITVKQPVEGIIVSHESISLDSGENFKLMATIFPLNANNQNVIWSSSNSDVLIVNQVGNIKALKGGNAVITVESQEGGFKAHTHVFVRQLVTKIKTNVTELQLIVGESEQIIARVEPNDADNTNILWNSSDNNIISVDEAGKITAIKQGSATITLKSEDGGAQTKVEVVVKQDDVNVLEVLGVMVENGYLTGLKINESVSAIAYTIKNKDSGAKVEVFNHANQMKKQNEVLATGDRVIIKLTNGEIVDYILAIKGDINGDGKISASDYVLLANHLLGKTQQTKQNLVAADINGDEKVSASDYVLLANHLLGKKKIHE